MVPDPGKILICRCVLTRGAELNGAFGPLNGQNGSLKPLTDAQGGVTEETAEEAFLRVSREQQELHRAVTCEDYERLARKTPGLALSRVRAVPRAALKESGPGVVIFAKPVSRENQPRLTAWQKQQILNYLEPVRMLGIPLEVRPARYCYLRVRVNLVSSESVSEEELRQAALTVTDSLTGPQDFGAEISYTALYAALGRVRHVRLIRQLELTAISSGVKHRQDGSILLAPDQLPVLAEFEVTN